MTGDATRETARAELAAADAAAEPCRGVTPHVHPICEGDATACIRLLARAFQDNPLNVAVIRGGPRARLRANTYGSRATIHAAVQAGEMVLVGRARETGGPAGLLVAASPYGYPIPTARLGIQLRCLIGQGWRTVRRWGEVYRILDHNHPLEPHWYLDVLGVLPGDRRLGIASALVTSFLERVDEDAMPSYLETDFERNVGFYNQWGYRVTQEMEVMGVRVWSMWRSARPVLAQRGKQAPVGAR